MLCSAALVIKWSTVSDYTVIFVAFGLVDIEDQKKPQLIPEYRAFYFLLNEILRNGSNLSHLTNIFFILE